jgi:aspartyl/glutamyl-tRNA(Asn/Gln) amidotransferase C subunit
MMTISRTDLERIAVLAQLKLSEDEADGLAGDCQAILEYFEIVREAGAVESEVDGPVGRAAPLREDRFDCDPLVERLEDLAPDWREGYFILPRLPALDADATSDDDDV